MPDNLLNEFVNQSMDVIAEQFFFRKLGICYDFRCASSGFPSSCLPRAQDIAKNLPDSSGTGTGMADGMLNNTILLEALALRFELGFARESEDRIFDRLIGGAIRLATIGPKSGVIRGLAPDGRSFYPCAGEEAYLLWAYYAWRICSSPAVAPDSQAKLRNIASRWISTLGSADFVIPGSEEQLGSNSWNTALYLPAILASVGAFASEDKWIKLALQKIPEVLPDVADGASARELLGCMIAVHLLLAVLPEAKEVEPLKSYHLKLLPDIDRYLSAWKDNPCADEREIPEFDWRKRGEDGDDNSVWERIEKEKNGVTASLQAACALMFCNDQEQITERAEALNGLFRGVNWNGCWLAQSFNLLAVVHARGVELQLWDKELSEYTITFDTNATLVEKFLSDDYDELNPQRAGHTEAPEALIEKETGNNNSRSKNQGGRSGGNRQKPDQANTQAAAQKPSEEKRPPRKRRRRRKKT